jgi:hypothetical protein
MLGRSRTCFDDLLDVLRLLAELVGGVARLDRLLRLDDRGHVLEILATVPAVGRLVWKASASSEPGRRRLHDDGVPADR